MPEKSDSILEILGMRLATEEKPFGLDLQEPGLRAQEKSNLNKFDTIKYELRDSMRAFHKVSD